MFIKFGILLGVVVLGGMIFSNEIDSLFPVTSATVIDSLKSDVASFGSNALDSAEQRLDESVDKVTDKAANSIANEISNVGDKITDEISEVKESSQEIVEEKISNFDLIEYVESIYK